MDFQPSARSQAVTSFLVMQLLDQTKEMQARGEDVIRLEAGEPDLPTPPSVIEAARRALTEGKTGYTPSPGTTELREAISEWYQRRYSVAVHPDRIVVTAGTSPALLLAMAAATDHGDEVLIADPGYPAYANAARLLGCRVTRFPVLEAEGFAYSAARIAEMVSPQTRLIMVNSPANPTGARVPPEEMRRICELGPWVISDEIYHELCYEEDRCRTALEYTDRAFILNGFSKRYAMPGLRLGWVVAPEPCARAVRNMNMNFYLGASSISQAAGLAALREADADVARMRETYRERRNLICRRLREIGFGLPTDPAGAFYVFANARRFCQDSIAFAEELLGGTRVSATPGIDFGPGSEGYLRFSYATEAARIAEGMERIERYLAGRAEGRGNDRSRSNRQ